VVVAAHFEDPAAVRVYRGARSVRELRAVGDGLDSRQGGSGGEKSPGEGETEGDEEGVRTSQRVTLRAARPKGTDGAAHAVTVRPVCRTISAITNVAAEK